MATQDAQRGSIAGALLGALGDNDVVREERTGVLLDQVASGQLSLVYNVLGSYAQARVDAGAPLGIVEPEDYTLVVLRTAVIPRTGPHPEEARRFLDYLLSPRGQQVLSREARLMPIVTGNARGDDAPYRSRRPIQLGPGLLVYLDALKRRQFLDAWRSSVEPVPGAEAATCPYNGGMSEYTILIADDHPLLRSAVVQSLRQSLPLAQVREVASADALAEALDAHPDVDLVLLDLTMPGAHGFSALLHVRGSHPDIPVVILSSNDHPRVIRRAQQFGAVSFIPKSAPRPSARPCRRCSMVACGSRRWPPSVLRPMHCWPAAWRS